MGEEVISLYLFQRYKKQLFCPRAKVLQMNKVWLKLPNNEESLPRVSAFTKVYRLVDRLRPEEQFFTGFPCLLMVLLSWEITPREYQNWGSIFNSMIFPSLSTAFIHFLDRKYSKTRTPSPWITRAACTNKKLCMPIGPTKLLIWPQTKRIAHLAKPRWGTFQN